MERKRMDIWDLYDTNRKVLNTKMERGDEQPKDTYRQVVHVCIFNSKGEMLIQLRQSFKDNGKKIWDVSVGGCSVTGEESWQTAERETFEKLGVKVSLKEQRPHFTINFDYGFNDVYIVEKDLSIEDLVLQYEEVKAAAWVDEEGMIYLLNKNTFIPYQEGYIRFLFSQSKKRGTHS